MQESISEAHEGRQQDRVLRDDLRCKLEQLEQTSSEEAVVVEWKLKAQLHKISDLQELVEKQRCDMVSFVICELHEE